MTGRAATFRECGCQAVSTDSQQVDGSDYVSPLGRLCLAAFLRGGGKAPIPSDRPPCEEQEASPGLESDTQSRSVEG